MVRKARELLAPRLKVADASTCEAFERLEQERSIFGPWAIPGLLLVVETLSVDRKVSLKRCHTLHKLRFALTQTSVFCWPICLASADSLDRIPLPCPYFSAHDGMSRSSCTNGSQLLKALASSRCAAAQLLCAFGTGTRPCVHRPLRALLPLAQSTPEPFFHGCRSVTMRCPAHTLSLLSRPSILRRHGRSRSTLLTKCLILTISVCPKLLKWWKVMALHRPPVPPRNRVSCLPGC